MCECLSESGSLLRVECTLRQETCLNQVWFSDSADGDPYHVKTPQCGLASGERRTWFIDVFKMDLSLFCISLALALSSVSCGCQKNI